MAEILSAQYKSVFTEPMPDTQGFAPHVFFGSPDPRNMQHLADISFSVSDIEVALGEIKPGLSPGPDG